LSAASNREGRRKREDDDEGRQGEDDDKDVPVHHDKKLSKKTPPFLDKTFFSILGPGIITGPSDDDPSGIATYSQAALFGHNCVYIDRIMDKFYQYRSNKSIGLLSSY
jgi:hypothetical protein